MANGEIQKKEKKGLETLDVYPGLAAKRKETKTPTKGKRRNERSK
jgi:hypothetical protein